jgi:hypothetical protein
MDQVCSELLAPANATTDSKVRARVLMHMHVSIANVKKAMHAGLPSNRTASGDHPPSQRGLNVALK